MYFRDIYFENRPVRQLNFRNYTILDKIFEKFLLGILISKVSTLLYIICTSFPKVISTCHFEIFFAWKRNFWEWTPRKGDFENSNFYLEIKFQKMSYSEQTFQKNLKRLLCKNFFCKIFWIENEHIEWRKNHIKIFCDKPRHVTLLVKHEKNKNVARVLGRAMWFGSVTIFDFDWACNSQKCFEHSETPHFFTLNYNIVKS